MSIEIDILNGDASWPQAEPLLDAVWPDHVVEGLSWRHVKWAHADLRVLLDAPDEGGLACHVGIYFRTVTWNGYVAPAATPKDIVDRIAREIAAGCKDAAFTGRLNKIGVDAVCSTPAEFERAVRDDLATWKEAVQAAGIKPQ